MTMPLDDRGLLLGDGLFETILAKDGDLVLFEPHIERMRAGCTALGLPLPDADGAQRLCELALGDTGMTSGRAAVRLTLTAGSGGRGLDRPGEVEPHIFAAVSAAPTPNPTVALLTSEIRRNPTSPGSRFKTLSYLDNVIARRQAAPGEALMLNTTGEIACTAAGNIFWIHDGRLFTPSLECGVLDGVMRRQVLNAAPSLGLSIREGRLPPESLDKAEAIFVTNSLIGVRPVSWIDGRYITSLPIVGSLAETLADVS